MSKAFSKDTLQELVGEKATEDLAVVEDEIIDTRRWSIHHRLVFKELSSSKFYLTHYSEGATEQQDESPFEYEDDLIDCDEAIAVEKVITVYEVKGK